MNRDELARHLEAVCERALSHDGVDWGIVADAAITALAPKLTWTEWGPGLLGIERIVLMVGRMKIAFVVKGQFGPYSAIWDGPILVAPDNTDEALVTLRAEIERRVREAMEGKP